MPVASHSRKLEKEEKGGGGVASQRILEGYVARDRLCGWLLGGGGGQT
jgi:hypothetical protein